VSGVPPAANEVSACDLNSCGVELDSTLGGLDTCRGSLGPHDKSQRTWQFSSDGTAVSPCAKQNRNGKVVIRGETLELFERGAGVLLEALGECPKRMWPFRPARGRWSIHEIILHLADSEAEAYLQCRQFIAEPASVAHSFDALMWVAKLGYFHQSTQEALKVIQRLRRMTGRLLQYIPDSVWRNVLQTSERRRVTLEEWAGVQAQHIPYHVQQIQRNYAEWKKVILLGQRRSGK
jgi:hypothetical protein